MVAQQQNPVDNTYTEIRELVERVRRLEARIEKDPSLDQMRAALNDLAGNQLPAVNKAIEQLRKDGQAISTRVTKLEKLPAELTKTNAKVGALDTRLQKLETQPETAAETAARKLAAYKGFSDDQMKAEVSGEKPEVLVEIAKRLKPKADDDRKVLKKLVDAVADKDGVLTAELITYAGTHV